MKLVIDAGHGGYDSGAVGNGLVEKNLTLQIARRVRDILTVNYPITIKMTRDSDVFISLSERANIANAFSADYFISFHINSGGVQVLKVIFIMRYPIAALHMQSNKNAHSCQSCINKIWSS